MTALPEPTGRRWQPLRLGLVDLFLYDEEEFRFRDGRLLLRGNNGTGKSKVLALTLPFLLDGEVAAHRVEPDGDPGKRMEWNLLLGGQHPHSDRLGYTWIEFGHRDPAGRCHYRTLGCGLKAAAGRGSVTTWFFVTDRRVGADLALVGPTRNALTRDRLVDALGERGQVYETAARYRRAVDEALFDLGTDRYEALVNLLIQLRQPQLSKRPNEKLLARALTESLPPVDQAVIADVADAFHSLEDDRAELSSFTDAHRAAEAFLEHYRRYAAIAARRRARLPRGAQSRYEDLNRKLAAARERRADAERQERESAAALERIGRELSAARASERVLRDSPEMRDARALDSAREAAERAVEAEQRATLEQTRAGAEVQAARLRVDKHRGAADAARSSLDTLVTGSATVAETAGLAHEHARCLQSLALPGGPALNALEDALRKAQTRTRESTDSRAGAIGHVRGLVAAAAKASAAHGDARRDRDAVGSDLDAAEERHATAVAGAERLGGEYVHAARDYLAAATLLQLPDDAGLLDDLGAWTLGLGGPNPLGAAVTTAARQASAALAVEDERLAAAEDEQRRRVADLDEERTRLERGEHAAPPGPYTRDAGSRDRRLGAPLWKLVDFQDDLDSGSRAGIEAALEASGVLDAWVTPDGRLLEAGTLDTVVLARAPREANLGRALVPAVDRDDASAAAVPDDVVAAVLAGVGLGPGTGDTWVSTDGRFCIGAVEGAWTKPAAAYVGHGAREAARRARLEEIDRELAGLTATLAELARQRDDVAKRGAALDAEVAAVPADDGLRAAHSAAWAAAAECARLRLRLHDAEAAVERARAHAAAAGQERDEGAQALRLPADEDGLAAVSAALAGYREQVAALWPAVRRHVEAHAALVDADRLLDAAETVAAERSQQLESARVERTDADSAYATLRETVGDAVAELERRLAEVARQISQLDGDSQRLGRARELVLRAVGEATGAEQTLDEQVGDATQAREEAAAAFQKFAASGLLTMALPDLEMPDPSEPWAPNPTVLLARQVEAQLAAVDDGDRAWERAQKAITEQWTSLSDVLSRYGHQAVASVTEEGLVVHVLFRGQRMSPHDLAGALTQEVADRQRILAAREREILENHLVSEVASHLQELISDAEAQVVSMNAELADRPTSTGMRLRFVWEPADDAPTGLSEARRRLLRQVSDVWSPEDRDAIGEFLQTQIAAVRARDESVTWLELLTTAFDYRTWHTFRVQRWQDGRWRSASGPASGGERALAVTIPLFAAAASHYRSAGNPHAPRLVLLDEAFAGVDDDARAKCLGLLAEFDLDVVMTSEREWGCYPTVPGLAIAHLTRREGIDAVLVSRWQWDGRARRRDDDTLVSVGTAAPPSDGEGLWG
jgi:uncharacterized protein (TIGR02680 family)